MLLADLAAASRVVTVTSRRTEKTAAVAAALHAADPDELPIVVAYLSGELRQRRTGVGHASLRDLPPPAAEASLGVSEVDTELQELSELAGPGSQSERAARVRALFARRARNSGCCGDCSPGTFARARSKASCWPPLPRPRACRWRTYAGRRCCGGPWARWQLPR